MVLDKMRPKAPTILRPISTAFARAGFKPNHLTVLAFLSAIGAGFLFYCSEYVLGSILVLINGILDAVDGDLARYLGRESKLGDLLDHTLDRYADVSILLGLSFSPGCKTWLGLVATISILLASYMGTQAQAVGVGRIYSGIVGRADRLLLLIVFPVIYAGTRFSLYGISLLDMMMIYFLVGGIVTGIHRFYLAWRDLKSQEEGK